MTAADSFRTLLADALGTIPAAADPRLALCPICDTDRWIREGRCADHAAMMREIREVWEGGSSAVCETLWSLSDGYGEPGLIPPQGYDWSGIRDSSSWAIEAMYRTIHA